MARRPKESSKIRKADVRETRRNAEAAPGCVCEKSLDHEKGRPVAVGTGGKAPAGRGR